MKKFLSVLTFLLFAFAFPQKFDNIQSGETLNYRIHYGILNAGTATLTTLKTTYLGQPHFYVKGIGKTTGAVRAFSRWMIYMKVLLITIQVYRVSTCEM